LTNWGEFIEQRKACLSVLDANSIQSFINELIEKYGEGMGQLS